MDMLGGLGSGLVATLAGSAFCLLYLIPVLIGVASFVIWIVALVDLVQRDVTDFPNSISGDNGSLERIVWLLIVLFTQVIGAIIYYFVVMRPLPRNRPRG